MPMRDLPASDQCSSPVIDGLELYLVCSLNDVMILILNSRRKTTLTILGNYTSNTRDSDRDSPHRILNG